MKSSVRKGPWGTVLSNDINKVSQTTTQNFDGRRSVQHTHHSIHRFRRQGEGSKQVPDCFWTMPLVWSPPLPPCLIIWRKRDQKYLSDAPPTSVHLLTNKQDTRSKGQKSNKHRIRYKHGAVVVHGTACPTGIFVQEEICPASPPAQTCTSHMPDDQSTAASLSNPPPSFQYYLRHCRKYRYITN